MLGGSPGNPAANPRTDTVYVPIQCTSFCNPTPGHVVDVINAAKCNAKVKSGCRVVARAKVGSSPLAAVIDKRTDTVYVVNGTSNTVSVLNGARCNARVTVGCGRPAATVRVGNFPVAAVVNPATRTLYVVSPDGNVFVINAASCNAMTTRGCGQPVKTVKVKAGSQAIDVDTATDTVYTANSGTTGNGDTVSVINGATCNGHTGTGCGRAPRTVKVGSGAWWVAVDQASDTVYVANNNDGTVSVINGATCNAQVTSGCRRTPPAVTTGAGPQFVAADPGLHTVFTVNQDDDTLSAINTRTCNGTVTSGCQTIPPSLRATPTRGPGFNSFPNAFALIPSTGSAYIVNVGGASVLSVTSIRRCNARNSSGCRRPAPAVPASEFLLSADPATNTIYGGNLSQPVIDVINGATCHARRLAGCTPVAQIPMAGPGATYGAIDHATHTLYASNRLGYRRGDQHRRLQRHQHHRLCCGPADHQRRPRSRHAGAQPGHTEPLRALRQQSQPGRGHQRRHLQRHRHLWLRAKPGRGHGRARQPRPPIRPCGQHRRPIPSTPRTRDPHFRREHGIGHQRRHLQRDRSLRLWTFGRHRHGRARPDSESP